MPQIAYRGNLSAAKFPLRLSEVGRTVIIPGPDNNFDRRVDPVGEQPDAGIPQAIYMENVIPTISGYQSVCYLDRTALPVNITTGIDVDVTAFLSLYVNSTAGAGVTKYSVQCRASGGGYFDTICLEGSPPATWRASTGDIPGSSGTLAPGWKYSTALVRGVTYFFDGVRLYNVTESSFGVLNFANISGTVTGLTLTDVTNICECANYLIALRNDGTIQWSSTTTPTDFVSSLVSGAGQIAPADLKGTPRFLKEVPNGFYIFTSLNVVFAQYTGNARYPFKFAEVANSSGINFPWYVTNAEGSSAIYGYFDTGLKVIQDGTATIVAPELTDSFMRNSYQDVFDYASCTFSTVTGEAPIQLFIYQQRFIILKTLNYAYWFDLALSRYGRLKVSGYLYNAYSFLYVVMQNRKLANAVIVQKEFIPTEQLADYNLSNYSSEAVLVLGKFQHVRSRMIKLEEIEFEGPPYYGGNPASVFSAFLLPSLNGRTFDAAVPLVPASLGGGLAVFNCHNTAKNHCVGIKGPFSANTFQLRYTIAGDR